MADYEQMEIDVRLDSERDLKDNITKVVTFTYNSQNLEAEKAGREVKTVRNKHEGYGIAAEAFNKIQNAEKDVKNNMGTYLAMLQVKGDDAVQVCAQLYDGALNLAMAAINMAADMHRILNDLYYGADHRTPLEKAMDDAEDQGDGFEEAEPAEATEDGEEIAEESTEEDAGEDSTDNDDGSDCEGDVSATEEGEE